MAGRAVALDTNLVVSHLRNPGRHDANLVRHSVRLSATALAELFGGAAKSAQPERNKAAVEAFSATCEIAISDEHTARIYGEIWASLAMDGNMIPSNDIWIAASAIQYDLPLITNDAHFSRIPDLVTEDWEAAELS